MATTIITTTTTTVHDDGHATTSTTTTTGPVGGPGGGDPCGTGPLSFGHLANDDEFLLYSFRVITSQLIDRNFRDLSKPVTNGTRIYELHLVLHNNRLLTDAAQRENIKTALALILSEAGYPATEVTRFKNLIEAQAPAYTHLVALQELFIEDTLHSIRPYLSPEEQLGSGPLGW